MSRSQVGALVGLRWRMVRARRARWGFGLFAAALPVLCLGSIAAGLLLPDERRFEILLVTPTIYLSVAVLAILAPLVAGGGNELFPAEQLTAYPISARTTYLASLALTPLNLAWTSQLLGLLGVTTFIAGPTGWLPLALVVCLSYLALVTVVGQAVGWLVVGARLTRGGRRVLWSFAAVGSAAVLAVVVTGNVVDLLDSTVTLDVVLAVITVTDGPTVRWGLIVALLLGLTALAHLGGSRACSWALRRPGQPTGSLDARPVRRRGGARSVRAELLRVDRASVWRSTSLRRGLLVLALLPGAVAAAAGLEWSSLILLPGLVSAGAGLLFGVNVFSLDGSGALWRASLPGASATVLWAKTRVVAETCLVSVTVTLVAGTLRAPRPPTSTELAAMTACAAVAMLRVVATCMELSVGRPHRADLRGPRDTPAPPGVMAAYSARLALSTTLVALVFSGLAELESWEWPVLVALPLLMLSCRRLLGAARRWNDPFVRAHVVTAVTSG